LENFKQFRKEILPSLLVNTDFTSFEKFGNELITSLLYNEDFKYYVIFKMTKSSWFWLYSNLKAYQESIAWQWRHQ
jgi:bisphosphoglycerate-independent phosphoglycerate mutase (AlkP superfamily)